jgi:CPA1 family monovalent cation:H+ antiporter
MLAIMSVSIAFILLLLLASSVAMFARRWQVPYTVALVVTGLLISIFREWFYPGFDIGLHLTPELLFVVLLPVLIYEAAFHFELHDFSANWKAIITLAAPGLVVGILAAALLFYAIVMLLGIELGFMGILLVATMLSATDPVAVISLLKEVGAPKRLRVLMEGESLVNDGVAVVIFGVVLIMLGLDPKQSSLTFTYFIQFFGWEILGALLIGGSIGWFISWLTSRVDDHLIEITLTTLAAYGAFLLADKAHASGVLACLVSGMFMGNFGAKYGMSPTTRVAVISFWEYLAFLANSFVFLLVGLEISPIRLVENWLLIILVWLAMIVARAFLVYGTLPLLSKLEGKLPKWSGVVITWGGLRGGIAMVLALSIPRSWEFRSLAIDIVFGGCLLTILVQGTLMNKLLKKLGLAKDTIGREALEEIRGRMRSLQAAIHFLDRQHQAGSVDEQIYQSLCAELQAEKEELEKKKHDSRELEELLRQEEHSELRRQLLLVRKASLRQAMADGHLGEMSVKRLIGELDELLHKH